MLNTKLLFNLLLHPNKGLTLSLEVWQDTIFVLREAKLLASLYHAAKRNGCYNEYPDFAKRHLFSAQVYAARQAQQIRFESAELLRLFEQIKVEAIFLKGAGYTLRDSLNSQGRVCSDIDVLVKKTDLSKAESHLKANRWQSEQLNDYDEKYYREWAHEVPPLFQINRATVLDMHHNVYLPISGRSPNIDLFLSATQATQNGCLVFSPATSIMHSIIHLFTNEDSSSWLRDLLDITLLIQEYDSPALWQEIIDLGQQTDFQFEVYSCFKALEHYSDLALPEIAQQFMQCYLPSKGQTWLLKHAILPAFAIEHSSVLTRKIRWAKTIVYYRGHWMKMPLGVLAKHFVIKSFMSIRDQIVGKYHFDPKLPQNPNW